MKTVTVVSLVVAMLSLGVLAGAQNTPAMPSIPLQKPQPGNHYVALPSHGESAPSYGIGWNWSHPENCFMYYSGGSAFLYVYFLEGGSIYTNDKNYQNLLVPACQTGNWIAFHVTDYNGDWDQLLSYTYSFHSQY